MVHNFTRGNVMQVTQPPQRYVDQDDDRVIKEIEPEGSRFKKIAIKKLDDAVEVRALEHGTENTVEFTADITEKLYQGVEPRGETTRSDIDDDIEDALSLVAYAVIDSSVQGY